MAAVAVSAPSQRHVMPCDARLRGGSSTVRHNLQHAAIRLLDRMLLSDERGNRLAAAARNMVDGPDGTTDRACPVRVSLARRHLQRWVSSLSAARAPRNGAGSRPALIGRHVASSLLPECSRASRLDARAASEVRPRTRLWVTGHWEPVDGTHGGRVPIFRHGWGTTAPRQLMRRQM